MMANKPHYSKEPYYVGGGGGSAGKSAYEVALDNGFEGSEEDWLESLVGPQGPKGEDGEKGEQGLPGANGSDGFGTQEQYDAIIGRLDALEGGEG